MVEVDEERPVEPPSALLERDEGPAGAGRPALVDVLAEAVELLERSVPRTLEDVGRELAPHGRQDELRVGRQDAEVVQVVRRAAVVADRVLELAELVEQLDLVVGDL